MSNQRETAMKKKEPRTNIFRAIPLLLNDNRHCLKFLLMAQQSITVYFYESVCVTHTLLLCVCVCACVCACDKHLHTVPYKPDCISVVVKTHELPVLSKYHLIF